MLYRKMLRELKSDLGMCISVIVLSFLAVLTYCGFNGDVIGFRKELKTFYRQTNFADGWIYSEGFTEEELEAVRDLDFVENAQLRTKLTGSAPDYNNAQTDIYLETENIVTRPLPMEGDPFDPEDTDGIWLNQSFAKAWDIHMGDPFTVSYEGVSFTKQIRGLVMTPEYLYTCADNDADVNLANLAYVYLAKDAFPVREILETAIENETLTGKDLKEALEENRAAKENGEKADPSENGSKALERLLEKVSGSLENMPKSMLLRVLDQLKDEDLQQFLPSTTMIFTINTEKDVMSYEDQISDALHQNYAAMIDEHLIIGVERFIAETEQHEMFSYTFAAVFVLIAVLIIATSMARLVERQRVEIGTMNALGIKRWKIALHYVNYSLILSAIGAILGFFAGLYGVANMMIALFSQWYVIPEAKVASDGMAIVVILVTVGACAFASFFACRKILKLPPAAALRPAAPKNAKKTLLERFPFWNHLGFASRYNLRDVSRAKFRTVMGIIGTACGMLCAVFAFGCIGLVDDVDDWFFERMQNFAYEAVVSDNAKEERLEEIARSVDGELVMVSAIELSAVGKQVSADQKTTQNLTVIEGKGLYRLTDPKAQPLQLSPGEIAITYRLANTLGVEPGDTVFWHLYTENTWYESQIGVISRSPETPGIAMLREDLEKTGCEFTPTLLVSDQDLSGYIYDPNITAVYEKKELRRIFLEGYEAVNMLVYFMLVISLVLIIAVLYNAGNMSFHERLKEFATLKVMGLSDKKIRSVLNLENIWLSIVGIFLGMPFARPLLVAMMNSNGDNFDYYLHIDGIYYVLSGLFVLAVTLAVGHLFHKKIRKLDMVANLKGAE